jgi:hypothetical protein
MSPIQRPQPAGGRKRTAIRERLAALVEEVRDRVPAEVTDEEIEQEAREAINEVREERRARRR